MKSAVLFSGGKDSCYSLFCAMKKFDVKYLISMISENPDSYMYHTPNIKFVESQSKAIGIPIIIKRTKGERNKEVIDLKNQIEKIHDDIDCIVSGAIISEYQKNKIDDIAKEFNLISFSPLWKANQSKLLTDMVNSGFDIIITSVSADGLDESWLGRKIDSKCIDDLIELNEKYDDVCGDSGSYDTFVLDGPIFKKKIKIIKAEKKWDKDSGIYMINEIALLQK